MSSLEKFNVELFNEDHYAEHLTSNINLLKLDITLSIYSYFYSL